MQIYLAGLYAGGRGAITTTSANIQVTQDLKYPWMLESYHYIGNNRIPGIIREKGDSIFLDSGAYSMFTQGIKVDLDAYADFIHANQDIIHVASNLDEIGRGKEATSYSNQKYLESKGVKIQPVHHARDADEWLVRYLAEGYDYIFLGGMVAEHANYLLPWLDRMWERYLTHPDGTARVKVHGFGLTTLDLMFRYPWFSVDSTSWVMASRMGTIYVDLPHKDVKVKISDQSPSMRDKDQHFLTFSKPMQDAIRRRIEELGYDVDLLASMYGWRDHFNIEYFRRIQERRVDRFINREQGLF